MLRRMVLLIAVATTLIVVGAVASGNARAADILNEACKSGGTTDSSTCKSVTNNVNPLTGKNGILYKVTLVVASVAGVVAVIMIVWSGFSYITSGGDAQKAASARGKLTGALIGLVIIVVAQSIITLVVSKL